MKFHLRFGMHRDAEILHQSKDLFEGLVIPAHILAYQPTSTSVFVTSLPKHAYLIDPMTYLFLHPAGIFRNDDGNLRPSLQQLCKAYHPDLARILDSLEDDEYVRPHILPNLSDFCKGMVEFQRTAVGNASVGSKAEKYLRRKGYSDTEVTAPRNIVAPYFLFQSVSDDWYSLAVQCMSFSQDVLEDGESLAVILHCTLNALRDGGIEQITRDFNQANRVLIWLEAFNQNTASDSDIKVVREAIRAFSDFSEVEFLYGGYLAVLSKEDGLSGLSHGILYTENKSIDIVPGSGGAPERYYIPGIHQFRSLSQSDMILHQFSDLICECPVCKEVLKGDPDRFILFQDNPDLLRKHFLFSRKNERSDVNSRSQNALATGLLETYNKYHEGIAALPNPDAFIAKTRMRGLDFLAEWAKGIRS